ncbi:MAG: 2-oxo acid dehydrogenase subunit E2, partial [Phototrophicaceae bacterium]
TITVSNLGMYGVDVFSAIVNPPGSAIIAVGAAKQTPVVKEDGSIGVASICKLTLSADHRAVNGAEGGQYMAILRDYLQNPMRLL